ncbi:formate dehydrogenase subunit alpha [Haloferula sargassicola]|uniref:Formate dehydrogenase SA2102 n=1 Tax=Haloferula sargassicola TaxID=490096 RepID=A0ABP9UR82_9BACT
MSAAPQVTIDGQRHAARRGETILSLINRLGLELPQVCHHPSLGPLQTCDTCMVEADGKLVRACAATVSDGMSVNLADSLGARREAMQRLIANHELYCTICDYNNGDCEVHNAADMLGLQHQKYPFTRKGHALDESNPFYRYDPDQCILCGRCVEACQDIQVTETLSIDWTMEKPRVLWDGGREINDSSCVSCGHCVTVCPCNALMEKSMDGHAGHFTSAAPAAKRKAIELVKFSEKFTGLGPLFAASKAEATARDASVKQTKTVCTYCGVGCSFDVWTTGRHILKIQPRPEAPANGISTCVKGKFGWDFVNSPDRLTRPLVRRGGKFTPVSWGEALSETARRLRAIADEHGPDSVGFISSSKTTNEEAYLLQKMARAVFGTHNIDNCARYCQSPASKGLSRTVGYGADSGTMNDIEKADLVVIVGSNTAVSHPVLAARIKRRVKLHGQRLIVSDLREHEMARRAHHFLRPEPGTDMIWMNAAAKHILDQGWEDRGFIEKNVNRFDEYRKSLEPFTLEYAAHRTGLPEETIRTVAREIAEAGSVCGLWAMGVTQHVGGTDTCTAFCNLLLLTGNFAKPGTGGYPLRGHNNVQGVSDFGALYNYFPGYHKVTDDATRARFEKAWETKLPSEPGLNNTTMIEAAHAGKLKALYVVGEELSLVDGNAHWVQEALRKIDFLVVQDIFMSTTAHFADVVFAAAPSLEKDGTFVNTERRIQRLHEVFPPLGDSRPDWRIVCDLAKHLGHDWNYDSPSSIMDEVASLTPEFAGVSYERLEGYGSLCWPVAEDGRDSPLLYQDGFHTADGRATFHPVDFSEPLHQRDETFTLHLNNGRVLEHFHEGNMTKQSPGLLSKVTAAYLDMAAADARSHGLEEGDFVRVTSPFGEVNTQVVITGEVREGELYLPICSTHERVNYLTSSDTDPVVDTPVYKEMSVKLHKLGRKGRSPMSHGNPRFGKPTPQVGVKVEKKWHRSDYIEPPRDRPEKGNV